jgi:hypothetical protein
VLKLVLHRLYLSAFWLFAFGAFATIVGFGVTNLHDHLVSKADWDCVRAELAKDAVEWADEPRTLTAEEHRRLNELRAKVAAGKRALREAVPGSFEAKIASDPLVVPTEPSPIPQCNAVWSNWRSVYVSTRAWDNGDGRTGPERVEQFALSFLSLIPLVLLVGLNRWIRWLLKPST